MTKKTKLIREFLATAFRVKVEELTRQTKWKATPHALVVRHRLAQIVTVYQDGLK